MSDGRVASDSVWVLTQARSGARSLTLVPQTHDEALATCSSNFKRRALVMGFAVRTIRSMCERVMSSKFSRPSRLLCQGSFYSVLSIVRWFRSGSQTTRLTLKCGGRLNTGPRQRHRQAKPTRAQTYDRTANDCQLHRISSAGATCFVGSLCCGSNGCIGTSQHQNSAALSAICFEVLVSLCKQYCTRAFRRNERRVVHSQAMQVQLSLLLYLSIEFRYLGFVTLLLQQRGGVW